ncbi:hypothetical protein Tco_0163993 [Tanacetum coccineum]
MTTSVGNNSVFRSFFEKQKLIGPNFIDWYRQLRLVLSTEDKENYLEHPIPEAPVAPPGQQVPPSGLLQLTLHGSKDKRKVVVPHGVNHGLDISNGNLGSSCAYRHAKELNRNVFKQAEQNSAGLFVQNYNMHGMGKTVNELHAMLKLHEDSLPKKDANPALHAIRAGRVQNNMKNKPTQKVLWGVILKGQRQDGLCT